MRERVASQIQVLRHGRSAQLQSLVRQVPRAIIRIMVPFPAEVEGVLTVKHIGIRTRLADLPRRRRNRSQVLGTPASARDSDDARLAAGIPGDGGEDRDAAERVRVHEGHVVPGSAVGRVDQGTLMGRCAAGDGTRHAVQDLADLVGPEWARRGFEHVLLAGRLGGPDVVGSVDLVEAGAFD